MKIYSKRKLTRDKLLKIAAKMGRQPTQGELKAMKPRGWEIARHASDCGGITSLLQNSGFEKKPKYQTRWANHAAVVADVRALAEKLGGFMPTCTDIRKYGLGALGIHCAKYGYRKLAQDLGLPRRDSKVKRGVDAEYAYMEYLQSKGFKVKKESTSHPWDLTVNGHLRVDMKTAKYLPIAGRISGYSFRFKYRGANCDLLVCVCLNQDGSYGDVYFFPTDEMSLKSVKIIPNPRRRPKWIKYKDETILHRMAKAK